MEELQLEILQLRKEIPEKDAHFQRARCQAQDFEDKVFSNEESYTNEINAKMDTITTLRNKIQDLTNANEILEITMHEQLQKLETLQTDLSELRDLR